MHGKLALGIAFCLINVVAVAVADEGPGAAPYNDYFATAGDVGAPGEMFAKQAPAAAHVSCDDFTCCFQACQTPCIYFQADFLYWDRVGTGCNQTVVIDTDTDSPLLSTDDLNFDWAPGFRFLVGWQAQCCSRCCAWELSYWGMYDGDADAVVAGNGDLAIPGDLGLASNNFFLADSIAVDYSSNLHNVELNCIKTCCLDCTKIDFIAGLRYMTLNDDLTLTATNELEGTSTYEIESQNNLFGFQLGGRLTRPLCCRWGLELTGKAALFYNDASSDQIVTDFPDVPQPFVLRDVSADDDGVAMLGEIGVVLIRPINDCWNVRFGYTAWGLGGVALASDQLDFTDTAASGTRLSNSGWIFAHGALAGLERRW